MEVFSFQHFIHVGNVLYLLAYLVRDVLWLRVLLIVAMFTMMPYYYFCHENGPMWEAIGWNALFIAINVVQTVLLVLERRPVKLEGDEKRLYEMVFRRLTPQEFKSLIGYGQWEVAKPTQVIVEEDVRIDRMMVVFSGRLIVIRDGQEVAYLSAGHFIGEMSYLSGDVTTAQVVAVAPTRYISWSFEKLKRFFKDKPALGANFQFIIGCDLMGKLHESKLSEIAEDLKEGSVDM